MRWRCAYRLSFGSKEKLRYICGDDALVVAMPFAVENGPTYFSLQKVLAIVARNGQKSEIRHLTSPAVLEKFLVQKQHKESVHVMWGNSCYLRSPTPPSDFQHWSPRDPPVWKILWSVNVGTGSKFGTEVAKRYWEGSDMLVFLGKQSRGTVQTMKSYGGSKILRIRVPKHFSTEGPFVMI